MSSLQNETLGILGALNFETRPCKHVVRGSQFGMIERLVEHPSGWNLMCEVGVKGCTPFVSCCGCQALQCLPSLCALEWMCRLSLYDDWKIWIWRQNCHGDMLWIFRDTDRLNRKLKTYQSKAAKKQWVTQWKVLVHVLYAWGGGDPLANWNQWKLQIQHWHDCIIERWGKQWKSSVGEDSCWISFHWTADLKGNQK